MELSSFLKKCCSNKSSQSRQYFVIFDRYNYIECNTTYSGVKNLIQNIMKEDSIHNLKPEHICVKETDHYLCHMDNMSKLKSMGYSKYNI
jgi:hypothetical protein